MIHTIVLIFHVLACLALVLIVLLQTGRGAEMGAAFGGSSQTLFGSSGGTTFFGKLTTLAAVVFMLTCLGLTYFSGRPDTKSVMEKVQVEEKQVGTGAARSETGSGAAGGTCGACGPDPGSRRGQGGTSSGCRQGPGQCGTGGAIGQGQGGRRSTGTRQTGAARPEAVATGRTLHRAKGRIRNISSLQ